MQWFDAMKCDALAIALPGWEYQDGDVITVDVTFREGYDGCETCGSWPDEFEIRVSVIRRDVFGFIINEGHKYFESSESVADFLKDLMLRGSEGA